MNHLDALAHPEFLRDEIAIGCFVTDDSFENSGGAVEVAHLRFIFANEDLIDEHSKDLGVLNESERVRRKDWIVHSLQERDEHRSHRSMFEP